MNSALFVVNQASGLGRDAAEANRLHEGFDRAFAFVSPRVVEMVTTHAQVRQSTRNFLTTHDAPYFLLAGGGAGTSRALIQGAMELIAERALDLSDIHFSSLRLGSGNPVPRALGISADPFRAMETIAKGLANENEVDLCVYACAFCDHAGGATRHYGITMGMFGPLGRAPHQVDQARQRYEWLTRNIAKFVPLEKINTLQYLGVSVLNALRASLSPARADLIEVCHAGARTPSRILGGFLLNFDLPQLPVRAECKIGEPSLTLALVPRENIAQTARNLLDWRRLDQRAVKYRVTPTQPIELVFLEADDRMISLDEDVFAAPKHIQFEVVGMMKFVSSGGES